MADAQDYAADIVHWARRQLATAGHTSCSQLDYARWDAASGSAVCGCGMFTDAAEAVPDSGGGEVRKHGGGLAYIAQDPIESALALIDPSEIYTPDDVERHILDTLYRLETGALFERETIKTLFAAEQAFDSAYYLAFHSSEQTSDAKRKAEAMVKTAELGAALNEAKMLREAAKSTMHNLRAVLSGYQSTARSVAATYNAGGSPGRY